MEIGKYVNNGTLALHVTPHSSRNELIEEEGKLKLYLHAPPEKDKANKELLKFFKKELGLKVEIISGLRSREKVVRVLR
ncbi:YggU family protein [Candidatus Woesearchaeota archaeon]|nr:YggU family protein [Candidatus Woesearchaeota archaeon]